MSTMVSCYKTKHAMLINERPPNVSFSNFDSGVPNMASTEGEPFKHALYKSLQKLNKAEIEIKEKQYQALFSIVDNKDTICILPIGYGKSLIYQLLPFMFELFPRAGDTYASLSSSYVFVISPLNALMIDQITKLKDFMDVSVLRAVDIEESMLNTNVKNSNPSKFIFAHPEALLEDKKVFQFLSKSKTYKNNLKS